MQNTEQTYNPEEEVPVGNWKIVDLKKQEQEDKKDVEEELFNARTKIYWWKDKQWKERGIGNFKIIKNKESGKIRCVHIQEQTFKIRAHFYLYGEGLCKLEVMKTAKNSYLWSCIDFSDDVSKPALEKFGIRFKTEDEFNSFKKVWEDSVEENSKLDWGQKKTEESKTDDSKVKEEKVDKKESQTQETVTKENEA